MASKRKLTPWFPANVKPVREGIYIATVVRGDTFYRYWDGKVWHCGGDTVAKAAANRGFWRFQNQIRWRGLAEKPKDAA